MRQFSYLTSFAMYIRKHFFHGKVAWDEIGFGYFVRISYLKISKNLRIC